MSKKRSQPWFDLIFFKRKIFSLWNSSNHKNWFLKPVLPNSWVFTLVKQVQQPCVLKIPPAGFPSEANGVFRPHSERKQAATLLRARGQRRRGGRARGHLMKRGRVHDFGELQFVPFCTSRKKGSQMKLATRMLLFNQTLNQVADVACDDAHGTNVTWANYEVADSVWRVRFVCLKPASNFPT